MLHVLKALERLTSLENAIGTIAANNSKKFLFLVENLEALNKRN
jgi:hypothetical protein